MYPDDGPSLQPNTPYRLVIEADNGRSSAEETTIGLGFKLLDTAQVTEINQIVERINAQNLPEVSRALTLANLYTSYNLIADAIQTLEAVPQAEKTADVYRQLGDRYRQIGLPLEAEVQYQAVIALAGANRNPFELAAAQAGLGEVRYALGDRDDAVQLIRAAKTGYERLGDGEQVTQLEARLRQIQE
jgi:tetratricopeptide (TPR) repeat protein